MLLDQSNNKDLSTDKTNCERRNLKKKLDSLYQSRATGYFIRSRARWVEEGERSTSYFLTLEKSRQASNCINCLKYVSGKQHHTDDGILNSAKSFYEQLYISNAASSEDINAYFQSLPLENQLDDESKLNCEGPITYEECEKALSKMKKKSPGLDGITTEFYQVFWPTLGNLLVTVFNEGHELGSLPESQRKSVMSLIFKKDDDEDIANYRPISLTNVDCRILAFTLAQRMQNMMNNIVNTDQSAYIKGR